MMRVPKKASKVDLKFLVKHRELINDEYLATGTKPLLGTSRLIPLTEADRQMFVTLLIRIDSEIDRVTAELDVERPRSEFASEGAVD